MRMRKRLRKVEATANEDAHLYMSRSAFIIGVFRMGSLKLQVQSEYSGWEGLAPSYRRHGEEAKVMVLAAPGGE